MSGAGGWQLGESGPEAYERYLVPAIFAPFAERLAELAAPGATVVDVACGTGIAARLAHARVGDGGEVVGVDANGLMIDAARAAAADLGPPVHWHVADAADLPLPDATADLVLCQQGLQFFADRDAALREIARVLAPGGHLAVSVWRPLEANPGFAVLVGALDRHAGHDVGAIMRAPFAGIGGEGLRPLLERAGLHDVRIAIAIEAVRFPSARDFLMQEAVASPLAGPFAALSDDVREALAGDLAEALVPHTDGGGVVFPMETFVATARR